MITLARDFLVKLREPVQGRVRGNLTEKIATALHTVIRGIRILRRSHLECMADSSCKCIQQMAMHAAQNARVSQLSWNDIGFKDLSFAGFDTRCGGMVIVDYGNFEYLDVLQFLCLVNRDIEDHVHRPDQQQLQADLGHHPQALPDR